MSCFIAFFVLYFFVSGVFHTLLGKSFIHSGNHNLVSSGIEVSKKSVISLFDKGFSQLGKNNCIFSLVSSKDIGLSILFLNRASKLSLSTGVKLDVSILRE